MADVDTLPLVRVYSTVMVVKVGVRELRSNLSAWLDRVGAGDEVVVTERGRPVARLIGMGGKSRLQELIEQGLVTPASRPKRPIDRSKQFRLGPGKTLSDFVIEMRRESRY
jgi:prevent-host-death family protein